METSPMRGWIPFALPLLLACGAPGGVARKLPSGRTVEVLRAGQVRFEATGETAAVMVYRTQLDPGNRPRLETEAQELWEAFRPDVEAKGLGVAILQGECRPRGPLPGATVSFGFRYQRQPDGRWLRDGASGKAPAPVTGRR